jgi:cytochrome c biogenesis protein CcdA
VLGAFAEAVRASTQPCTVLLIVPMSAVVLVARCRPPAVLAALGAGVLGGWVVAANRFVLAGASLRAAGAVAVVGLLAIAIPPLRERSPFEPQRLESVVAGGVALLATLWWRPCVGEELGAILTASRDDLVGQLPGMTAYVLGAMVPVMAIALAAHAVDWPRPVASATRWSALAVGLLVAGALAIGRHDDLVVTLTRWTVDGT